jgi:polyisoprenoid-binding protein YceI
VSNFVFNRVPGTIEVRFGSVQVDPEGRLTAVSAVLDASSIATGNPRRDKDLMGPRFFNVSEYREMLFTSTSVAPSVEGWTVEGLLTVGPRQAPITLEVELVAPAESAGVTVRARGSVDRAAAGIKAPSFVIGREVLITVEAVLSAAHADLPRADVAR